MNPIVMLKLLSKTMKSLIRWIRLKSGNWPELSRYCCCKLSIGIYIHSILNLLIMAFMFVFNGFGLSKIIKMSNSLDGLTVTVMNRTVEESELAMIQTMLVVVKSYVIVWMVLKIIYILSIFAGCYAIFCNKSKILNVAFYVMLLNLIFDVIIVVGAKSFTNTFHLIVFVILLCTQFYNMIAINSLYKQMIFKSRIVPKHAIIPTSTITNSIEAWNPGIQDAVCSNYLEIRSERTTITSITTSPTPSEYTTFERLCPPDDKTINFKDGPIIFDQRQLQPRDSLFIRCRGNDLEVGVERCTRSLEYLDLGLGRHEFRRPRRPDLLAL